MTDEERKEKTRAYARAYREEHREALAASQRTRYTAKRQAILAMQKAYYQAHKEQHLRDGRRSRGVRDATGEKRAGACPICLREKALVLDHCKTTGFARGWLCSACNLAIGSLGDTLPALRRGVAYLETSL